MTGAIRIVTVERGIDPRDFLLCGFGGAGPVHVVRLAREFGIPRVIVPRDAGVMSAVGLLTADVRRDYTRTRLMDAEGADPALIGQVFEELEAEARSELGPGEMRLQRSLDARFKHQAHELTVPVAGDAADAAERFRALYRERYGVERREAVQFTSFR